MCGQKVCAYKLVTLTLMNDRWTKMRCLHIFNMSLIQHVIIMFSKEAIDIEIVCFCMGAYTDDALHPLLGGLFFVAAYFLMGIVRPCTLNMGSRTPQIRDLQSPSH